MPMLQGRIFHYDYDIFCMDDCYNPDKLEKSQFLAQDPVYYGNACQDITGPHPLDTNSNLQILHFEFGEPTDEEGEKKMREQIRNYRNREAVKRRTDEHLEKMHETDNPEYNEGIHTANTDQATYEEAARRAREDYRAEQEKADAESAGFDEFGGDL